MSEQVAKGRTLEDGTYLFTCGHCNGAGQRDGDVCSWCYGLDTDRILAAMRDGTRGQRYYGLLKAYLSVKGKTICDEAQRLKRERGGTLTLVELGYIHLKYGLNFKATVEWLEETSCIRSGTYDLYIENRWKVKDIVAAARERYPDGVSS